MCRRHYIKAVALVLLVTFCQRLGASLWVHHFYHEARVRSATDRQGISHFETRCDCLDDAFMPMDGASVFVLPAPSSSFLSIGPAVLPAFVERTPARFGLRGPPPGPGIC